MKYAETRTVSILVVAFLFHSLMINPQPLRPRYAVYEERGDPTSKSSNAAGPSSAASPFGQASTSNAGQHLDQDMAPAKSPNPQAGGAFG